MDYNVVVVNTKNNKKSFLNFLDVNKDIGGCLGIDLEFNNKIAAIIQLCFVINNIKHLWIIEPNSNVKYNFIKYALVNDKYLKILHGSESLDIPFLFKYINNDDDIIKFISKFVDTRFMCEYYNIKKRLVVPIKCSLYYCLLGFGVVDDKIFNKFMNIEKSMGDIWKIKWDIDNLDKYLDYVVYDVFYLIELYKNELIYIDQNINKLHDLVRFTLLVKNNIVGIDINTTYNFAINNIYDEFVENHDEILKNIQYTKKYFPLFIKNNIKELSQNIL